MALPTIKVAVSNGHFQESLQNWGDRGTWDSATYDGSTNTTLEDKQAIWVVDEFNGYIVVTDTGGTPTALPIVDTTGQTIVVAGNHLYNKRTETWISGPKKGQKEKRKLLKIEFGTGDNKRVRFFDDQTG